RLRVRPEEVVVIGDIGSDLAAARAAGAHGVLVPTPVTRTEEITAAAHVAPNLLTAVRAVLTGPPWGRVLADERPIEAAYTDGPWWQATAEDPRDGAVRTAPRTHRPVEPSIPDDRRRPR
ncbi:HAD hydrolase-like protein, partial [Streptomyces sp. SID5998]|nr:HAD hydrolase-like protein [Streptomyces sp. SID5998]